RRQSFGRQPDQHDKQPDMWNIGVPIRQRLVANLNDSDGRHQRAEIPKPAHGKVRAPANLPKGCESYQKQGGSRNQNFSERRAPPGIGVENSEIDGPKGFDQVREIAGECIFESEMKGKTLQGLYGLAALLGEPSHGAAPHGKKKPRDFFSDKPPDFGV